MHGEYEIAHEALEEEPGLLSLLAIAGTPVRLVQRDIYTRTWIAVGPYPGTVSDWVERGDGWRVRFTFCDGWIEVEAVEIRPAH